MKLFPLKRPTIVFFKARLPADGNSSFAAVLSLILLGAGWLLGGDAALSAAENEATREVDYLREIKPILAKHCFECHSSKVQKSGLRLDTAAAIIQGGDSGPGLEKEKPEESLIIQAVTGADGFSVMPPKGDRLTTEQIARLKAWIAQGAKAPADETAEAAAATKSQHWSFQPVVRRPPPVVRHWTWVRNPIDSFIAAKLEEMGLEPSAEADRVTQIRRLSLDLLGLPPTPAEVDQFLNDRRPDAYEQLVDRLLSSRHYGERWGRYWLDASRYADSNGFTRDMGRSIWKYRDWVIDALNRDVPFDQFTIEQMAGDLLPEATLAQRVATGFHRNTLFNEEGGTDPEQFRVESIVDRVSTTSTVFLGLTVGCAQCHDHKYDPISQREFYQFFAFLNNADEPKLDVPSAEQIAAREPEKRAEIRKQIEALDAEFKSRSDELAQDLTAWEKSLSEDQKKLLPFDILNAVQLSPNDRSEEHKRSLNEYFKKLPEVRKKYPLLDEVAQLRAKEPQFATTLVMQERAEPRETHVHIRGDFLRKGARVQPAVPAVLNPLSAAKETANRLDLAKWLVDPQNPLTARVTMNRFWQKYFGRGIVETENDFGTQGAAPTHLELLDWLAAEFVSPSGSAPGHEGQGTGPWSMKRMHKLIVTSATYRQASRHRPELAEADPANKWLARQSRLRLDAEVIRDVALAASGLLSEKIGGPSVYPPQPEGVFDFTQDKKPWKTATGDDRYRRGMYTYLWRSSPYPAMSVFDFPDANVTCTRRNRSNTPLQSLTLANDATFLEFSRGLANRIIKDGSREDASRVRDAFRICLAREPNPAESSRLTSMVHNQREGFLAQLDAAEKLVGIDLSSTLFSPAELGERAAWVAISRVLMNLDEFITRE